MKIEEAFLMAAQDGDCDTVQNMVRTPGLLQVLEVLMNHHCFFKALKSLKNITF